MIARNRTRLMLSIAVVALASACGGGGEEVSTTPPPPPAPAPVPPPPPVNSSLLDPMVTETFTAEAATGSAYYPADGTSPFPARRAALAVTYDADARTYTITQEQDARTFGVMDSSGGRIAGTASFRTITGATTERLLLTKGGTSGAFSYEYAGAGLWERLVEQNEIDQHDFSAFTFGIRTPDSAMPRTGDGSFAVALLAKASTSFGLLDVVGSGVFSVNFVDRTFVTDGVTSVRVPTADGFYRPGPGTFSGSGMLASGSNVFLSSLTVGASDTFSAVLQGSFFGPEASELAGSFYGHSNQNRQIAGSLIGRRGTSAPMVETLDSLLSNVSLSWSGSGIQYNRNASGTGVDDARIYSTGSGGEIRINPHVGAYNLMATSVTSAELVTEESDQRFSVYRSSGPEVVKTLRLYRPGGGNSELALSYASFGSLDTAGIDNSRREEFFIYGLESGGNVPRSGHGQYQGVLHGSAVGSGGDADRYSLHGNAAFNFDFSAATFTGSMNPNATNLRTGTVTDLGLLTFNEGQIYPFYLAFGGKISSAQGATGQLNGRFYGPTGEEIGSSFSFITPGAGTTLIGAGAILGKRQ